MENNKLERTDLVPTTESTVELIPEPTARVVEKSFAENTLRNRRQALKQVDEWLRGRSIADGLLAQYITDLFNGQSTKDNLYRCFRCEMVAQASQWREAGGITHYVCDTIGYPSRGSRQRAWTTQRTHVEGS